jgi:hypothetical protein
MICSEFVAWAGVLRNTAVYGSTEVVLQPSVSLL